MRTKRQTVVVTVDGATGPGTLSRLGGHRTRRNRGVHTKAQSLDDGYDGNRGQSRGRKNIDTISSSTVSNAPTRA